MVDAQPRRVTFALTPAGGDKSPTPQPAAVPMDGGGAGWKIRAVDACTPPPSAGSTLAPSDWTPASAAWLESARKVDDLRSRLESLEDALRAMESKAVAQLDKHLQEKVLATAMKLVEKRFSDRDLDQRIQEQVLNTAMKLVSKHEAAGGAVQQGSEALCKKLELDFAPPQQQAQQREAGVSSAAAPAAVVPAVRLPPATDALFEEYAAHIESGLGEVVRRLEIKVDALQYLADNDMFGLLEARVTEVLGALEERVVALEQGEQVPAEASSAARLAALEATVQEQQAALQRLLESAGRQQETAQKGPGSTASIASLPPAAPSQGGSADSACDSGPSPASQLRRRRPGSRLAATSGAGAALQSALETAKQQVAKGEAAAASAQAAKRPWWRVVVHVLGWALLAALGLAACLVGILSVATKERQPLALLS